MSPGRTSLHGVAVAIDDIGLLILGESGAGKSALAARLLSDGSPGQARLVADDRVIVSRAADRLVARPHPALAGLLEIRGFGIVPARSLDAVVLRMAVRLERDPPPRLPDRAIAPYQLLGTDLPCAWLPAGEQAYARFLAIWPYISRCTTFGTNLDVAP